ncbi:Putative ATP-dependent DNA helicase YjcD [Thermoflexales bacterium]|nr:Putative ATP-dependent DNA helicase YjcD [Thermoflexales bacterium]
MAQILPDAPLATSSPGVGKVYRLLKHLPDTAYAVWQRLGLQNDPGPDFWVLREDRRGVLFKVSTATPADVRDMVQASLFPSDQSAAPVGVAEHQALRQFALSVSTVQALALFRHLPAIVVFPNLSTRELDTVRTALPPGMTWWGKERLAAELFESALAECLGTPLPAEMITALRRAFTPEVIIPPSFTVRKPIERNTAPQLTEYLLDYLQERVLKSDLDLSDEAQTAAGEFGLRLVNGVAGSGKSLIVVYRAHLLHRLYPDKSILVLTHNRPLIRDLEARYQLLNSNGHQVEMRTFLAWCRHHWPRGEAWHDPIGLSRRERLIEQVWYTSLADTAISAHLLQDEIDWFKDRLLFTREEYLNADRTGRGFALNEALRHRIFDALEAYQRELEPRQQVDWSDIPRRLWHFIHEGRLSPPVYDVVLVDEAQFFAPIWFEIIKRIVKPGVGHLFLAADPTQGFLKRGQSWRASGLEVRGRTHKLEKSYRTTREILNFATLLYRTRLPEYDEDIVAPDLLDMPKGATPVIIPLTSEQDEVTRVVNEVRELFKAGIRPGDILIIHAEWQGVDRLLARLRHELGPRAAADPKETRQGNHIRVCTLNAATGLESPIVLLCGVQGLYEQEQSIRLSDDERAELIRDNTRKLYMAITRAGQRLVLMYVGELPAFFQGAAQVISA